MPFLPAATENSMIAAGLVPSTTYYMSLHSGSPGSNGANEITGGGYGRQAITFGAASAGIISSTNAQTFTNLPAEASGCPYFGLWTTAVGGTYMGGGTTTGLSTAIPAGAGAAFAIAQITAGVS